MPSNDRLNPGLPTHPPSAMVSEQMSTRIDSFLRLLKLGIYNQLESLTVFEVEGWLAHSGYMVYTLFRRYS